MTNRPTFAKNLILILTIFLAFCYSAEQRALAKVTLSTLFVDGGIIQRDKPVNVFGTGRPGEIVTCEIGGNKQVCIIKANGNFFVSLPAPQGPGPFTLRVAGDNFIEVKNLQLGEIWIVAGDNDADLAADKDSQKAGPEQQGNDMPDNLQLFKVSPKLAAKPVRMLEDHWIKATEPGAMTFSSLALKYGCDLAKQVGGPIGIIQVTLPETPIRSWISPMGILSTPDTSGVSGKSGLEQKDYDKLMADYHQKLHNWQTAAADIAPGLPIESQDTGNHTDAKAMPSSKTKATTGPVTKGLTTKEPATKEPASQAPAAPVAAAAPAGPPLPSPLMRNAASALFNGMIAPLTPYSVRGAVWYHGKSDLQEVLNYKAFLAVFMKDLRQVFRQDGLPIILVQTGAIADPQTADDSPVSVLRQVQYKARLAPRTYMAVSLDLTKKDKKNGQIKVDLDTLAQRITNIALSTQYQTPAHVTSPVIDSVEKIGDGEALKLQVRYADKGLQYIGKGEIKGFSIGGWNHQFFEADAQLDGDTITVQSKFVKNPKFVRYCWGNCPTINLFNSAGLPLVPYTSDR